MCKGQVKVQPASFLTEKEEAELLKRVRGKADSRLKDRMKRIEAYHDRLKSSNSEEQTLIFWQLQERCVEAVTCIGDLALDESGRLYTSIIESCPKRKLRREHIDAMKQQILPHYESAVMGVLPDFKRVMNNWFRPASQSVRDITIGSLENDLQDVKTSLQDRIDTAFEEILRRQKARDQSRRRERYMILAIVVGPVLGAFFAWLFASIPNPVAVMFSRGPNAVAGLELVVQRVIDGDTFVIEYDGEPSEARLVGIDAPDLKAKGGPEAKAALEKLVLGKTVRIGFTRRRKRDDFGRLLVKVYIDDLDVGAALVRKGLAKTN